MPARSAAERLMRLDAVLTSSNLDWLTTRSEKVAHLHAMTASQSSELAEIAAPQDAPDIANQFPGVFPIGIDPNGHVVALYLATVPWTDDFRMFLVGHTALLRATSSWTLRIVFPQPLCRVVESYRAVVHGELESPLNADAIYDLKRYFFHRRRGTDLSTIPEALRAFLVRCAQVCGGPRFTHLYKRWLTEDEAALAPVSPAIPEALASGRANIECPVLPHTYEHLSPLVTRRRTRRRGLRRGEQRGGRCSARHQPAPQPGSLTRSLSGAPNISDVRPDAKGDDAGSQPLQVRCTREPEQMIKTVEAIVDEKGNVKLLEQVRLGVPRRALVTIFDEKPAARVSETALLSEATLGEDWNRTEEDEAWSHLQRVP